MDRADATSSGVLAPSIAAAAVTRWRRADRGWKAIVLSALLLVGVRLGVQIPW
jgi:hypothetical protein